jgi:arabinose-5-phosphate isomerase
VGLITDGDLRRTIQRLDGHVSGLRAKEFMTAEPVVIASDALAFEALRLMEDRPLEISVLPVLRDGACIGMVRLDDLVQSGI